MQQKLELRTVQRTDKKLHPLIFSHGTLHARNLLPSETEDPETEFTYMDSTSTLAVGQGDSFLKCRRRSGLGHLERSLADSLCTKQSYTQIRGTLGSALRPFPLVRRNSTGCTY